jgi:hypothetical protein
MNAWLRIALGAYFLHAMLTNGGLKEEKVQAALKYADLLLAAVERR